MPKAEPRRSEAAGGRTAQPEPAEPRELAAALGTLADTQANMSQVLANLQSQNLFLSQQIAQLGAALTPQLASLSSGEQALLAELRRFQTGGPQHAMAAVFHKLFRELLVQMNQLDALVALAGQADQTADSDRRWIDAIGVLRGGLEATLSAWGCAAMPVEPGVTVFDPEIHEALPSDPADRPPGQPPGRVVSVRRRGWKLHGVIIQFPQVIVS